MMKKFFISLCVLMMLMAVNGVSYASPYDNSGFWEFNPHDKCLIDFRLKINVDTKSRKDAVVVTFENPAANQSTLRVASSAGNSPVADYTVDGGAETYDIPASNMVSGIYQVTLIENGKVTGTKKFVK